jgi:phytoene dehydrogenase-like protein
MAKFDNIVIGAGHNGLVCATKLARAGQSVSLLESSESVGGLAASREFAPGFRTPVAHSVNHFRESVAKELGLASHGLVTASGAHPMIGLSADGNHVQLDGDKLQGVGDADRDAYDGYRKLMQRFAGALEPFWLKTIPRIAPGKLSDMLTFAHLGLNIRRMGKQDMREFLRIFSLPMRDLMDEYFESDRLKALLSWDGLIGSKMAPRSPNHAVLTLLYRMAGQSIGCEVGNLVSALESAAVDAGVEIRTDARVDRILVEADVSGLRAKGVRLHDGEEIQAGRVVSSADPRTTFLKLVGVESLEIGFADRIRRLRCKGYVAKLHLALDGLPSFNGLERPGGRMIIAREPDAIEFAFDHAKYGEYSEKPVMEMTLPSMADPSLAPSGHHVLSAHVMFAPYDLKGGWHEASRAALAEKAITTMESCAPGIRQSIVGSELLAPPDIERIYGVTGGHWHHAETAVDQMLMMRPTYEAAQYATPVPGLYLCGAGSHPGGDLTGAPGYNAAREILK